MALARCPARQGQQRSFRTIGHRRLLAVARMGRQVAACVSGVPVDAADDGLFGPASVAWRVSTDLA